jgi:hypothetical protein
MHGVYSERVRNQVSDALLAELRDEHGAEWINSLDHAALLAFVNSEAVCRQLRTHLLRVGHAQAPGTSDLLRRWEGRAAAARDALGLSPASRARLARDVGAGAAGAATAAALAQMAANGRKALLDRGWIDAADGGDGDGTGR